MTPMPSSLGLVPLFVVVIVGRSGMTRSETRVSGGGVTGPSGLRATSSSPNSTCSVMFAWWWE
eukprot:5224667-Pyramimonas_sp.AAC.1